MAFQPQRVINKQKFDELIVGFTCSRALRVKDNRENFNKSLTIIVKFVTFCTIATVRDFK